MANLADIVAATRHKVCESSSKADLRKLERQAAGGRMKREVLEARVKKALQREHLSAFVVTSIKESQGKLSLHWEVDAARRRVLERTRLGRRVLCTDHHNWSNGRIVHAFRGQWNVEELFRRAKKGGIAPWGPSHQWADHSLRLHTFATVIGLTLVSLVRLTLGNRKSAQSTENPLGGESHHGAGADQGTRSSCHRDAGARRDVRTAQGNQGLRVGSLDASTSFIYTPERANPRYAAYGMRK